MDAPSIIFPHLGITIQHLGKSVTIFGFPIAYYGIIVGLGMLCGILMAVRQARATGQSTEMYYDFALYGIVFGVIGARIYYVVFEWDYYSQNLLQIFNLRAGGLAIYGGVIAAVITAFTYSKLKKVNPLLVFDTAIVGLITGQIIGRWGNFFNREAFGSYTDGLLAMQIRVDEAAYTTPELLQKAVMVDGVQYIQVHPTFLYESLWNLMVLIILLLYTKHKKFDGEVLLLYLLGYGIGRFMIEGLRTDQLLLPVIGYPVSRALSACLVVLAVILIILGRRKAAAAAKAVPDENTQNP